MVELDIGKVLEDITGRQAREYTAAMGDYLVAVVMKNKPQTRAARLRLEEVIRESMGAAEVLGATSMLRRAAKELTSTAFASDRLAVLTFANTSVEKILHRVTFEEAVEDMVARTPVTIRDAADRTAATIRDLYAKDNVVAFARSAEEAVTLRAKDLITQAIREGIPEFDIGKTLKFSVERIRKETAAWTEGYARMAFRTNLNTAVTAGRFRQASDPVIRAVIPAFRFTAVGDGDTRHNHGAADGVILKVDNSAWRFLAPPLGYNCRCEVDEMSIPMLRRAGALDSDGQVIESTVPSSARPDEGFRSGGRPDLFLGGR